MRSISFLYILISASLGILAIGMIRGESSLKTYFELQRSQEVLDKTVNKLEEENRALSQEIYKLKNSKDYARKVLRDKYHVTEADENIVFFAD